MPSAKVMPHISHLQPALDHWPATMHSRASAVLMLFIPDPDPDAPARIVFTRRSTLVRTHKGQIGFPGVQLVRRNDGEFERLPIDGQSIDVLGLPIRSVKIQVAAGRNLAVLVEAAVRNTILQLRGIDTLKEFMERQRQLMASEDANKNQTRLI